MFERVQGWLRHQILRAWNSPTITGWAKTVNRTGSFLFLTPLLLTRFEAPELALYYLFQTFNSLVALIDFGFAPTFNRFLSYARGGLGIHELESLEVVSKKDNAETNWHTVREVTAAMHFTYRRLAWIAFGLTVVAGPLLLLRPISHVAYPDHAWIAFALTAIASVRVIYRQFYSSFLEGMNHVALNNRWEAFAGAVNIVSSVVVLLCGGGFLAVVISFQFWELVRAAFTRVLARNINDRWLAKFSYKAPEPELLTMVWSRAWRSGTGNAIVNGFSRLFGFVIAQFMAPTVVAGYLFASRMISALFNFSVAGFNPKIPQLSALRASGHIETLRARASRNMTIASWAFVIPVCVLGIGGEKIFALIDSKMPFPSLVLWALLAVSAYVQGILLMHMNIFQLTNKIIAHKVSLILAASQAIACYGLIGWLGIYAMPLGSLLGVLFPLVWVCRLSYSSMETKFWSFERRASGLPSLVLMSFLVWAFWGAVG